MGSWLAERRSSGRNAAEAWRRAVEAAQAENGHQDGYSGDINSGGHGFTLVALPPRYTYAKLQSLLEDLSDGGSVEWAAERVANWRPGGFYNQSGKVRGWKGQLRKAEAELKRERARHERLLRKAPAGLDVEALAEAYGDKWGDYLAVELRGAEAKRYGGTRRRGEKTYVFFGYAPC
jgi:hypothetical protein